MIIRERIRTLLGDPRWAWARDWAWDGMVCLCDPAREGTERNGRRLHSVYEAHNIERACPDSVTAIGCGGWGWDGKLYWVGHDLDVGHGRAEDSYETADAAIASARAIREFVNGAAEIRRSKSGAGLHVRIRLAPSNHRNGRTISRCIAWWLQKRIGVKADHAVLGRQNFWFWAANPGERGFELIEPCSGLWTPPEESLRLPTLPEILAAPLPETKPRPWTYANEPRPIDLAARYVAKIPGAVSGQGGHNKTFHVACVLVHGFALDNADALTVLREYNARCVPPWSEQQLLHKLRQAGTVSTHRNPRAHLLTAALERWRQRNDRKGATRNYTFTISSEATDVGV